MEIWAIMRFPWSFTAPFLFFDRSYSDIFQRIKISGSRKGERALFNHFFDMSAIEASASDSNTDLLSAIVRAQEYVDLNLWKVTKEMNHTLLLLKGQFLLIFSLQLDGMPLMTFVSHKSYLNLFINSRFKNDTKSISFGGRGSGSSPLQAAIRSTIYSGKKSRNM